MDGPRKFNVLKLMPEKMTTINVSSSFINKFIRGGKYHHQSMKWGKNSFKM